MIRKVTTKEFLESLNEFKKTEKEKIYCFYPYSDEELEEIDFYLDRENKAGLGIRGNFLTLLHRHTDGGHASDLINFAISKGANELTCLHFMEDYYKRYGFRAIDRGFKLCGIDALRMKIF